MPISPRRPRRAAALAVCVTASALGASTAQAGAIPFGADLNRPATNGFGCETFPGPPSPFDPSQVLPTPSGQSTCTWTANGLIGSASFAETLTVPGTGVVTQVRVKVGPVTGPMRVSVYSSLLESGTTSSACCQVRAQSQVFTPRANGVTRINVNLPVVGESARPIGEITRVDALGLTVLRPGVPVPAHATGAFQFQPGSPTGGVFAPGLVPGTSTTPPAGLIGFQTLLNAEWLPVGAAGAGGAGSAGSSGSARCGGQRATIVGTNRNDVLRGTARRDVIVGLGGNDRIIGLRGNDILCGGPGRDVLLGGPGNDRLLGGSQNDVLAGGSGRDNLNGGPGRDRNRGGPGKDTCRRGAPSSC